TLRTKVADAEGLYFQPSPTGVYKLRFNGLTDDIKFEFAPKTSVDQAVSAVYELFSIVTRYAEWKKVRIPSRAPETAINVETARASQASPAQDAPQPDRSTVAGFGLINKSACYYLPDERGIQKYSLVYKEPSLSASQLRPLRP